MDANDGCISMGHRADGWLVLGGVIGEKGTGPEQVDDVSELGVVFGNK